MADLDVRNPDIACYHHRSGRGRPLQRKLGAEGMSAAGPPTRAATERLRDLLRATSLRSGRRCANSRSCAGFRSTDVAWTSTGFGRCGGDYRQRYGEMVKDLERPRPFWRDSPAVHTVIDPQAVVTLPATTGLRAFRDRGGGRRYIVRRDGSPPGATEVPTSVRLALNPQRAAHRGIKFVSAEGYTVMRSTSRNSELRVGQLTRKPDQGPLDRPHQAFGAG